MYLILAAALAGLSYMAYETLSARYFPSLTGKPTSRSTKKSTTVQGTGDKVLVATDGKGKGGYPASVQPYEEEWIPEHLTRKTGGGAGGGATRRKTATVTSAGEGAVSAGEVTSGGEGEKKKVGGGKGKGKGRK
jgi:translocon-associated protein subunit alpha